MGSSMGRRKESKQQELLGGLEHDFYMTFPSYWVLLGIMIIGNNDPS
jgi:hypothetical protein